MMSMVFREFVCSNALSSHCSSREVSRFWWDGVVLGTNLLEVGIVDENTLAQYLSRQYGLPYSSREAYPLMGPGPTQARHHVNKWRPLYVLRVTAELDSYLNHHLHILFLHS